MNGVRILLGVTSLAVATTLAGCGEKLDAPANAERDLGDGVCEGVTYETAVKAITEIYCTSCHSSELSGAARRGAPARVDLDSYEGVKARAERVLMRIEQGTMPPVGEKPTPEEAEMMRCWVEGGSVRE